MDHSSVDDNRSPAKCSAVVTLYQPDDGAFKSIETYYKHVDKVYVVDNSPQPSVEVHERLNKYANVKVVWKEGNVGLGRAINIGIKHALEDAADWLLTMDQDSYFCSEQLSFLQDVLLKVDYEKTAVVAPTYEYQSVEFGPCKMAEALTVITSGSFVNLALAEKIGMFNEDFFIDEVDHEYCLRANQQGYKVLKSSNCFLMHSIGTTVERRFLWKKKQIHEHSPKRIYFIARNDLYMRDMFGSIFPKYLKRNSKIVRRRIIRMLKYSPNRSEYLKYYRLAKKHHREGVLGNPVGL